MGRSHAGEIDAWRAWRRARLQSPEGWLALVGLVWLDDGEHGIGSDPSSSVILPGPEAPARLGSITVRGGRAAFTAEPGVEPMHEGRPVTEIELQDDRAGHPTVLTVGALTLHLIRREGRLAIRIRNADSPAISRFQGLEYFPIDIRWRIAARWRPHGRPISLFVPNVLGTGETMRSSGRIELEIDGQGYELNTFLEAGEKDLFIVFGDLTNGVETYRGGRYVYASPRDSNDTLVVDFNKAYNPPCVFTAYATCTLPLPSDRLPVRVEAGEMRYAGEIR